MAIYGANDGLYGTGTFGTAVFGSLSPVKAITGVFGTGVIEPPEIGGFEVDIGVRLTATTVGTGSVGSLQPNIKAEISGVTATGQVGSISTIHVSEIIVSAGATTTLGTVTPTAVVFDFNSVRDQYSRKRSVTIPRAA
jgi:hypothetical protein